MTIWRSGGLAGYDSSEVELCVRFVGQRPGEYRIHDGMGIRWIPRQYVKSYRYLKDSYCIITIPSWLAKREKFRMKRQRFPRWAATK